MTEEDVITQNQTGLIAIKERFADDESICQTTRFGLNGIFKTQTPLRAILKQALEKELLFGGGDD